MAACASTTGSSSGLDQGFTPLVDALLLRDEASVRRLLSEGHEPNQKDVNGHTPLMVATRHLPSAIEMLLAAGARVDDLDSQGNSALIWAVGYVKEEEGGAAMNRLLAAGAAVNPPPPAELPLHEAVRNAPAHVPRLLAAGADPNGTRDASALAIALFLATPSLDPEGKQPGAIFALLEAGAEVPSSPFGRYPPSPEGLALVRRFEEGRALARALPTETGLASRPRL